MTMLPLSASTELLTRIQSLTDQGSILPLFKQRHRRAFPADYVRQSAVLKRLLERWSGDPEFRAAVARDPEAAVRARGLDCDVRAFQLLVDPTVALSTPVADWPLATLRYRSFGFEKLEMLGELRRNHATLDPRYAHWRTRQMNRTAHDLPADVAQNVVHAPFCIELCNGCSVGCWFCGISAPRLSDIFLRTPENAALYASVVETMQGLFGQAAGQGFCYWATDPMDNPDYERFLCDFHDRTGEFPQTTTALPLKDVARTHALLALSREKGGLCDRFSLLTLRQLDRVHQEFSPEELLHVELVLQNKEHRGPKAQAGRASQERPVKQAEQPGNQLTPGTIACVSGFLINMVTRSVKLISPCQASERWPLGYIVFAEATFADGDDFRSQVHRMVDDHMRPLRLDDPIAFYDHLTAHQSSDGLELATAGQALEFVDNALFSGIAGLLLQPGGRRWTVDTLLDEVVARHDADAADVLYALQVLQHCGVLDVQPRAAASASPELVQLRL